MPDANIDAAEIRAAGTGTCGAGDHPDPPLDAYPLLCWTADHARFGKMVVHTEDQRASVHDVAVAFATNPSAEAVAKQLGTTVEHVDQAIRYADEWRRLHAAG